MRYRTWFGCTTRTYEATLGELHGILPEFEHRGTRIIRRIGSGHEVIAEVSTEYVLVQHREVVRLAMDWVDGRYPNSANLPAALTMDMSGRRMNLQVDLPFGVDPGDGHVVMAALNCTNSVDRSTPLLMDIRWWRKVCTNGMFGWVSNARFRALHRHENILRKAERYLSARSVQLNIEQQGFRRLLEMKVTPDQVRNWVQKVMVPKWGLVDAGRLWSICSEGLDGQPKFMQPGMAVERFTWGNRSKVPGAAAPATNLYHVGQAASWIASRGWRLEQQASRMAQVWKLLEPLAEGSDLWD